MGFSAMNTENKAKDVSSSPGNDGGSAVPSGFILKLYQMVNGAPDEVISWTPSGDAFIIGSDLNRLESETLPQYFRHNRFQSLVRQLNFYSFRKINRERNVWIYKHKLFHRDRPEDLHMVRRRTCPGVDGRKQRFSRFSAQKLSKFDEADKVSSDDETSLDDSSVEDSGLSKKRMVENGRSQGSSKRSRRLWHSGKPSDSQEDVVVDTSILSDPSSSPRSVFDTQKSLVNFDMFGDDDASANKKNERLEMLEQSMIVSEVAMKLEEFARKALKGRGASRTRRGVAGVVTPPWGSSQNFSISSQGLITYDDEYESNGRNVIMDDDSLAGDLVSQGLHGEKSLDEVLLVAPVADTETAKEISDEIRHRASFNFYDAEIIHACANLADLFMLTPPNEEIGVVSKKVLDLLSSSSRLASDFHFYRAALHPEGAGDVALSSRHQFEHHHAAALRQALECRTSRRDALREFKVFAVNLIYKLLGKNGSFDIQKPFSQLHHDNLQLTAEAWSKSVGTIA